MVKEHTQSTEGLLTHVGMADCFITLPHPALECGIVTAWWQCQVEGGTRPCGGSTRTSNGSGDLRSEYSGRSPEEG
jgi:hypothetical protein